DDGPRNAIGDEEDEGSVEHYRRVGRAIVDLRATHRRASDGHSLRSFLIDLHERLLVDSCHEERRRVAFLSHPTELSGFGCEQGWSAERFDRGYEVDARANGETRHREV